MSPDAFVEPWTPEIGARVRVMFNPECQAKWGDGPAIGHDTHTHANGSIGRIAEILASDDPYAKVGHPYLFHPDDYTGWPYSIVGVYVSAGEIEPL